MTIRPLLPQPPRNREELLEQYPFGVDLAGHSFRQLDDCLTALRVFSAFANDIAPHIEALDEHDETWTHALSRVLEAACRRRVFSLAIPRALGGSGLSMLALSVGLECLGQTCVGVANLVATHGLALAFLGATGNTRWLRKLAERIVKGERSESAYLLATAATEPSAGSDLEDFDALGRAHVESHADACTDGYCLHGRKLYVSNGSLASALVVIMPTDRSRPRDTLCAFLVDAPSAGLTVVRNENKLGQRASPAAELLFDGCIVAKDRRLNQGSIAGRTLDLVLGSSRAVVSAFGSAVAHGVLHTSTRLLDSLVETGNLAFTKHPRTRSTLAQMWMNATMARQSYLSAAAVQRRGGLISLMESEALRKLDRLMPPRIAHGALVGKLLDLGFVDHEAQRLLEGLSQRQIGAASAFGSSAKIATSELALANCELALELFGHAATRADCGLPKYFRDARLLSIYEGTNEICSLDVEQKARRWM